MSDAPHRKRSLASLWLIVALAVAPVAGSYLMYYFWPPERSVNYGELLEPRALPDAALTGHDGAPFSLSSLKGKWVLAMVDGAACDAYCEKKLIYMRQLRLTQGKNMDRVERLWLVNDSAPPRSGLLDDHAGLRVARAGRAFLEGLPARPSAVDHIYLIDPLGNLMMRYPRDPEPNYMIKDLTRLLKASRIG
jgi:cytochrome oxidase Cu insertion factor (SCO1/SenC/PrrC family)